MKNRCKEAEFKQKISDRFWRLNNLYFITDKVGKKVKFKLNWAQQLFIETCHNLNIILKVRQLGFTTLACIIALDMALFNSNYKTGIIAHNKEESDKIFRDKVKYAYDNLPDWLRKLRPANTDRAGEYVFNNGSGIRVSTSFRGGTLQFLHISEFGKICARYPDKAREIVTGALNSLQAGQTVCIESTAEGRSGYFFEYCEKARSLERKGIKLTSMDYKFYFFTWTKHPDYKLDDADHVVIPQKLNEYFTKLEDESGITLSHAQKVWYLKKWEDNGDDMQREYPTTPEEAFSQVIKGAYYAKQIQALEKNKRFRDVPYDPSMPVDTSWDLGLDDATAIWFFQEDYTGAIRVIDYLEDSGEDLDFYVRELKSKNYNYGKHYLPHDVNVKSIETNNSRLDKLRKLGMTNMHVVESYPGALADGISAVRSLLPLCYFDQANTADGFKALKEYKKAWDDKAGTYKDKPNHDWTSHGADAFRMYAKGRKPRKAKAQRSTHSQNKYRKRRA